MANGFSEAIRQTGVAASAAKRKTLYGKTYNEHGHRIYSLAFWMTDHELAAEQLAANTFLRAFSAHDAPRAEQIDLAFLAEVRELMPLGGLSLSSTTGVSGNVRGNVKRVHLERAVVQLPPTERLIFLFHDVENYEHARIARLLGISESESQLGLHQARLHIREQIAQM
jgi:RNA polymerase sigma-70 factor, ECF subfamily